MRTFRPLPLLLLLPLLSHGAVARADWPPRWTFADGWQLAPSASWQYDALHADVPGPDLDHDGFRRQRTALTLTAPGGTSLKLDYDFASGTWSDLLLRIGLGDKGALRVGQLKTPMSLEVLTSHRALNLLERSPVSALVPGRRLAVEWARASETGTVTVVALGDNIDDLANGHGLFARATRNLGLDPAGSRWHLGLAAGMEWPDGDIRVRGRPDVSGLPLLLADSGLLDGVDRIDRIGLETAWDRGPLSVQAEHVELRGSRSDADDVDGRGSYLSASWRPTGEARRYRAGVFDTLQPAGPRGALEVVARASWLDVDTDAGDRRDGRALSLGLNWYLTGALRLQAQVTEADGDGTPVDRIHGLRVHYQF
jgi:phosphate-selective porin OprO/OprP